MKQRTFKGFGAATKKSEPAAPQKSAQEERKSRRELKRMEEEKVEEKEEEVTESSDEELSEEKEEPMQTMEEERKQMRSKVAADSLDELRPNAELYKAVKDRYQELIKDLWKSQSKLEEFGFSEDEKKILNDRVKLWLEYFAITSAFRDENVNLFEYIDSFCETQKYI